MGISINTKIALPGAVPGPVVAPRLGVADQTIQGLAVANPNLDPGAGQTTTSYNGTASTSPNGIADQNCSSGLVLPANVPAGQIFVITAASIANVTNPGLYNIRLQDMAGATDIATRTTAGAFGNIPYTLVSGRNARIIMLKTAGTNYIVSFDWSITGYYQTATGAPGVPPSFTQIISPELG